MVNRAAAALIAAITTLAVAAPATNADPMTTHSGSALGYLKEISGKKTIAGQHNREPNSDPGRWTHKAHDITGHFPGLWGGDFLFAKSDVDHRKEMIDQAITERRNGAMVSLSWHMCPPTQGETCDWDKGVRSHLSDKEWSELVTDGSKLNKAYKDRLDSVLPHLQRLKDAGVQVLFRPLHEMNNGWSWWGGRQGKDGSAKLFQITRDYLVGKGMTNLVWNWNVQDTDVDSIGKFWPGDKYADIATLDVWQSKEPTKTEYKTMRKVAGRKPIGLGEVGTVPSPELLAEQPGWTYFMVWAEYLTKSNSEADVKKTYADDRVLVLDEMKR